MFGKKRKIMKYLGERDPELYSQFDYVLDDQIKDTSIVVIAKKYVNATY